MRDIKFTILACIVLLHCIVELSAQVMIAEETVFFQVGSHKITQEADSSLQKFIREINSDNGEYEEGGYRYTLYGIDHVEVVAHTDAVGEIHYNELLSKRRAESVRDWLIANNIDSNLCVLSWKGEIDSLVSNTSDSNRQLNRRTLIRVYAKAWVIKPENLIEGNVLDSNDAGIDAKIVIRGKRFLDSVYTDSTGYFSILAPDTTVYGLDVFAKGYIYTSQMFKNDSHQKVKLEFKLTPVRSGVTFQLHRFYFVGNQAVLLQNSEPELVRLMRFMTLNPTTIISIEGHINYPNNPRVSMESTLFDLSERRARMVYDYLLDHNINPRRMSSQGFGNWHMVYPNARTEDLQRKNRRVEIRIIEQ